MIGQLDAARALLTQYGQQLRQVRTRADLSMSEVAALTGVQAPYLSRIEHGRYCPTADEAAAIARWVADLVPCGDVWELTGLTDPGVAHARMSDPVSSDVTVKSIAADGTLADKIVECARDFQRDGVHIPFDDTDLVEALQDRWPRPITKPWQRNVVARARGLMMTKLVRRRFDGFDLDPERVPRADSPLQRHGLVERVRDGHTRQTVHYVWTGGNTDTRQEEGSQ